MKRSTERFLTTHTGSLPRPDDLIRMMFAKEEGVPVDRAALAARIKAAVAEVVAKQAAAGVDIVNDGELSKPSYATYIKDRLGGFDGTNQSFVYQDLAEFPALARKVFGDPGRSRRKVPACTGPITVRDPAAAATDVANLQAALAGAGAGAAEAFMPRPASSRCFSATITTRAATPTSPPSPTPCAPNTGRSPTLASSCRSIARIWRWAGTSSSPTRRWPSSAARRSATSRR
jgi:Cobalamin-independent synthase, Catalytic domain